MGEQMEGSYMTVKPLGGIRVVELATFVAAPSAGAIMADLGADVIKIEPPSGDTYRGLMRQPKIDGQRVDFDAAFAVDNRGKRSLALDVTTEAGQSIMHRLVATAQIFVCNMLPARQQRYRFDPESLKAVNPSLVHATLTGYGTKGDEADRPGFDVTAYFARGGFADMSSDPDTGEPSRFPQAAGDHSSGLALLSGVLAALRLAERTGEFQVVETSLLANSLWAIAGDVSTALIDGRRPTARNRHEVLNAAVNTYRCGDGRWILVNVPVPAGFPAFCRQLDLEWVLDDERFGTPRDRFRNMAELVEIIDERMLAKPASEWGRLLDEENIVWAPVQSLDEVAKDKQIRANGYVVPLTHRLDVSGDAPIVTDGDSGDIGVPIETVAVPFKLAGAEVAPGGPVPAPGADTRAVLAELGFDDAAIDELRRTGVLEG